MTIAVGTKVSYWPDREPFRASESYTAEVLGEDAAKPEHVRLSVSNPHTGRTFLVSAREAASPTPGAFKVAAELASTEPAPAAPEDAAAEEIEIDDDIVIDSSVGS